MAAGPKKDRVAVTDTVLRDAHQSLIATRMTTADMTGVAELMDRVGYWSVEMWGGATFDSCMRFLRESPWERVRELKKAMPNTRFQMLLRGQNVVGYRHYADDVAEAFVETSHRVGIDVFRIFDALNDTRNMATSIRKVKEVGALAEGCICYTQSPVHTLEYFVKVARECKEMGCDTICIKDMAGILSPYDSEKLVAMLCKEVGLPVHLHCHYTSGMASGAYLKGIEAGARILDTAISAFSMGTSQPPTETVVAMLKDTPFDTGLDLSILTEITSYFRDIRKNYTEFESEFTGVDSDVLLYQIPGGMMSNLANQLREADALDKMAEVFEEVPRVRKELGYPPLVTPTSQIVGTQSALNVIAGERYKVVPTETKNLIRGLYGRTPAPIDPGVQKKVIGDEETVSCRPADLLKPELPNAQAALGTDNIEDVLCYVLFPQVAEEYFASRERGTGTDEQVAAIVTALVSRFMKGAKAPQPAENETASAQKNLWGHAGRIEAMRGRWRM
jgi:pyruvate/oxaloacetate carboxyltransferase